MKIHDALIYELIKPDKWGKPTGDGIIRMVGTSNFTYLLEHTFVDSLGKPMTPDMFLMGSGKERRLIIIELETDRDFDFGASLRQIKKYKTIRGHRNDVVKVIIPHECEQFAPFYKNEGIDVWFWKATRILQCLRCKSEVEIEGPFLPKCEVCKKNVPHRLLGVKDAKFNEFTPS